jgi:hypothetical protein
MLYLTIQKILADSDQPLTVAAIAKRMRTHKLDSIRNAMIRHPDIFFRVAYQHIPHQHGLVQLWALVPEPEPEPEPIDPQLHTLLTQAEKAQRIGLAVRCLAQSGEDELARLASRKFWRESDTLKRMCNHAVYEQGK